MSVNEEQLQILRRFPCLVPQCRKFCSYRGHISAGTEHFFIALEVPHYPSQQDLQLQSSTRMQRLLGGNVPPLGESLFETLCILQQALEAALARDGPVRLPSLSRMRAFWQDVASLSGVHVISATATLDRVILGWRDGGGRRHELGLRQHGDGFIPLVTPNPPTPDTSGESLCSIFAKLGVAQIKGDTNIDAECDANAAKKCAKNSE